MKILAHAPFIGTSGYANHARSFFCALNKYHIVKVRNYTVGSTWKGYNETPHDDEPYLTDEMKDMLILQTLHNNDNSRSDFPIYGYKGDFKHDINIVLMETNHHYFYDDYKGYKIAYNVWESTRYPEHFFNRLLEFDEVWVPTRWQYDCIIEQGYPKERVSIVPEGVDVSTFKPISIIPKKDKFRFLLFGRWDFRKSTTEILQAFSKVFKNHDDVELICSVENPFPYDGIKTVEERIQINKIDTKNMVFVKFVSRTDYIKYLQEGDVFVSCARSEGWNLPLIEAMACGIPSIYSDWGGQLQFAGGRGIPVKIEKLRPAILANAHQDGVYAEPDFEDLAVKLLEVYKNYDFYRGKSLLEAKTIHEEFNWDVVAKNSYKILENSLERKKNIRIDTTPKLINIHNISGPYIEVKNNIDCEYQLKFVDKKNNKTIYEPKIRNNWWSKCGVKYYVDWMIVVESEDFYGEYSLDLKNKRVLISFESKSLGDTLAWIPYVEEFRKKHDCKIICSTFHNNLFKKTYKEFEFVNPGSVIESIVAQYSLGVFKKDGEINYEYHPNDPFKIPLQKIASDILGLEYKEIKPIVPVYDVKKKKRVCIAIHSTAQAKYWNNPNGWQTVVNYLKDKNYEVRLLSKEEDGYMGNFHPKGIVQQPQTTLENILKILQESELFIGIGSGLSWLAWSANIPVIMISGFSDTYTEPLDGIVRIINREVCNSCWNSYNFDPGDWNWCPLHKNTPRQFECSKNITAETVINEISRILD